MTPTLFPRTPSRRSISATHRAWYATVEAIICRTSVGPLNDCECTTDARMEVSAHTGIRTLPRSSYTVASPVRLICFRTHASLCLLRSIAFSICWACNFGTRRLPTPHTSSTGVFCKVISTASFVSRTLHPFPPDFGFAW